MNIKKSCFTVCRMLLGKFLYPYNLQRMVLYTPYQNCILEAWGTSMTLTASGFCMLSQQRAIQHRVYEITKVSRGS